MQKKVNNSDKINRKLIETQKENAVLKIRLETRKGMAELDTQTVQSKEIYVEGEVKKCKKCNFTAANLKVLGLHMENDHQYVFYAQIAEQNYPSKTN